MEKYKQIILRLKDRRGVTVILVAILIVVLLGFVALAVDVGYVMVTRNDLQNISDAASLAATRQLGAIYEPLSYQAQQNYICDPATIIPVAKDVAAKNQAGGKSITVNDADVIIGTWNAQTKRLEPTLNQPDAVKVIARRDGAANGPIATFFAKIFGINTLDVSTDATAALTGQYTAGPGGLPTPIGISRYWFEKPEMVNFCDQPIRFYPTNDPSSCGGWHVYDRYSNMNDRRLRDTIEDIQYGRYQSPETIANQTQFSFGGGTMSTQTFAAMKSLFDSRKVLNDGIIDNDTDPTTWTTVVPVYNSSDCGNPNQVITIVGFATIVITEVLGSPTHQIDGRVICNSFEPGRGGGGEFGTKGSIPGLVE